MQGRMLALVGLAFSLSDNPVADQSYQFRNTDRADIAFCDQKDLPDGYDPWTQVGVARLLPELLGADEATVHLFFIESLDPSGLTADEQQILNSYSAEQKDKLYVGRSAAR